MKLKLIHFIILSLFAISVFVSCASPDESSKIPADTQSPAATVEATEAQTEAPTEAEIETETTKETQTQAEPQTETPTEPEIITEAESMTDGTTEEMTESVTAAETEAQTEILCENDEYTITLVDGKCYIKFADENYTPPQDGGMQLGSIDFSSLSEMKQAFIHNALDKYQIQVIRTAFANSSQDSVHGIEICNFNNLYHAVYPDGVTPHDVSLIKKNYTFHTTETDKYVGASTCIASPERYAYFYENNFLPYDSEHASILNRKTGQFDGVPCETIEYEYPGSGAKYRDHVFDINLGGTLYQINVNYCLKAPTNTNWRESETLPASVNIFCQQGDALFFILIDDLKVIPTVEWLTSFGITPYVENADQVTS